MAAAATEAEADADAAATAEPTLVSPEPTLDETLVRAAEEGYDGLEEILATADIMLDALMQEAGISQALVDEVLAGALSQPVSDEDLAELELLDEDPEPLKLRHAREILDAVAPLPEPRARPNEDLDPGPGVEPFTPIPPPAEPPADEGEEILIEAEEPPPPFPGVVQVGPDVEAGEAVQVPEADTQPFEKQQEDDAPHEERSVFSSLLEEAAAIEEEVEEQVASADTVPRASLQDEDLPGEPLMPEGVDINLDEDDDDEMDEAATRVAAADLFERPPPEDPPPGDDLFGAEAPLQPEPEPEPELVVEPEPAPAPPLQDTIQEPDLPGAWASELPEPREAGTRRRNYLDELEDDTISDAATTAPLEVTPELRQAAAEVLAPPPQAEAEEEEDLMVLDLDAIEEASVEELAELQRAAPAPDAAPPPIPTAALDGAAERTDQTPVVQPLEEMEPPEEKPAREGFFKRLFTKK